MDVISRGFQFSELALSAQRAFLKYLFLTERYFASVHVSTKRK